MTFIFLIIIKSLEYAQESESDTLIFVCNAAIHRSVSCAKIAGGILGITPDHDNEKIKMIEKDDISIIMNQ